MSRRFGLLLVATMATLVLSLGCVQDPSTDVKPGVHSSSFHDATTTASVKIALAFEPGVRARDVDVDTHQGMVTLTGVVRSEAERRLALKVAEDVEGVSKVVNHIQVRG